MINLDTLNEIGTAVYEMDKGERENAVKQLRKADRVIGTSQALDLINKLIELIETADEEF